jgi:hypothetical protein
MKTNPAATAAMTATMTTSATRRRVRCGMALEILARLSPPP